MNAHSGAVNLMKINSNFDTSSITPQIDQKPIANTQTPTIAETFFNQPNSNIKDSRVSLRQSELSIASSLLVEQLKKTSSLSSKTITTSNRNLVAPEKSVAFIRDFNGGLGLKPADLQEKQKRMAESSFVLFRAMPSLFYKDIKGEFAASAKLLSRTAPNIVINGDMHIENFGTFRGPDGKAVWGINDFDQSDKGSPEWDLERLATSAIFVARQAGLGVEAEKALVSTITKKYVDTVKDISQGKESTTPYLSSEKSVGVIKDLVDKSSLEKRKKFLEKYTSIDSKGNYQFLSNDKLKPVSSDRASKIKSALSSYEDQIGKDSGVAKPLRILDVTEKLGSGGSSYGLPRYYALVANDDPGKAPIILEVKALLPAPIKSPSSTTGADGEKTVERQQTLSSYTNPLVGSLKMDNRSFLVRELEPEKNTYTTDKIDNLSDATELFEQAAKVLARAHSQVSGQAEVISNWIGKDEKTLTKRLTDFSRKYADQTEVVRQELAKQIEL